MLLFALFVSVVVLCTTADDVPQPTSKWTFYQQLDHFSYGEISQLTFPQTVYEYNKFWNCSDDGTVGPLFVYTGNEGPLDSFYDNTGFMFDIAPKFGALIVFIEHRYYGSSLPFGPEGSFTPEGLAYLSSIQATADFAAVIEHLKRKRGITQVVSFGGSYGGMLTAWMRLRYPQLVDIAVAASAPLPMMAKTATPDRSFFQIVTDDFAATNTQCPTIVRDGFTKLYSIVKTGAPGYEDFVKATFSLCDQFDDSQLEHLVGWVRNGMLMMAMVDYPYPAEFFGDLPAWPVATACNMMVDEMDDSGDPLKALVVGAGLFYNGTSGSKQCFDIYKEFIECADITGCGTGPEAVAWDFQCCTEFQLATPSNNVTDMFPPLNWNKHVVDSYCRKQYGVTPDPVGASMNYWSADFRSASNIIFSNGLLDPWHAGGVLEDVNESVKAIIVKDGAHHLDLRGSNKADPESVIEARKQEVALIENWLGEL